MNLNLQHRMNLSVGRDGVVGRRDFLRGVSLASLAAGTASWTDVVSVRADELRRDGRACILLWMQGGPSQFETFDPKPGPNGGETKAIATKLAGVQFADNLPKLAGIADRLAIVRSMSTKEGNHQRASFLMHTSYVPTATVHHPTMGAIAAKELPQSDCELPAFVRIGRSLNAGNGGLLGTEFDAFVVQSAAKMPDNVRPTTDTSRYTRRLALVDRLEVAGSTPAASANIYDHKKLYEQASRMVLSPQMSTFDISKEPDSVRQAYGSGEFASGCLLARRLIEAGVTFVEVSLGNWDTHDNNFDRARTLCGQLDQPFAALIEDLRQRGMLERTLVVWTGEFGRTPRVNPRGGRDHFPRAFSAVLAGGGIRTGQVLGSTNAGGDDIVDDPVTEKDLFQTIYKALRIDARKEHMSPIGRPIRIVDGGTVVDKLLA